MKIVGTVEARMGSSRLPGKTMIPVYEQMPLLGCVVERFRQCRNVDEVVVATTTEQKDDVIADWCDANGVKVRRGSEDDVLDRVVQAALSASADVIVQMGADSAYLDFHLIDHLVDLYRNNEVDYVCNDLELTYPLGIYGHVVGLGALKEINERKDLTQKERADVVRYIWEHKDRYRILNIRAPEELRFPEVRLTIDYPADMALAKILYSRFKGMLFSTQQVLDLYKKEPELFSETRNLKQESAPFIKA